MTYQGDELTVVVRGRQGGKTTALLKQLRDDDEALLVVLDEGRRLETRRIAMSEFGFTPDEADRRILTIDQLRMGREAGTPYRKALVDDAHTLLQGLLGGLDLDALAVNGSNG